MWKVRSTRISVNIEDHCWKYLLSDKTISRCGGPDEVPFFQYGKVAIEWCIRAEWEWRVGGASENSICRHDSGSETAGGCGCYLSWSVERVVGREFPIISACGGTRDVCAHDMDVKKFFESGGSVGWGVHTGRLAVGAPERVGHSSRHEARPNSCTNGEKILPTRLFVLPDSSQTSSGMRPGNQIAISRILFVSRGSSLS
ncbi:hypothetical protein Tco_0461014 [Tanacetum coccineum]